MRIISGKFKGRKFFPPAKNWPTRPTTDFNKEALYNILQNRLDFEDIRFLDLFGGTGSHCFECISRGCQDATYVDKFRGCVQFVKELSETLDISDSIHIRHDDVFRYCRREKSQFDFIFAGPPYPLQTIDTLPELIFDNDLLSEEGSYIIEHGMHFKFDQHPNLEQVRKYGQTYFSFFRNLKDL